MSIEDNISKSQEKAYKEVGTPSNWLPRWMQPVIDSDLLEDSKETSTLLTSIYNQSLLKPFEEIKKVEIVGTFNQEVWWARHAYTIPLTMDLNEIFDINLLSVSSVQITGEVRKVKDESEFSSIFHYPIGYLDSNGKLLLGNIDLVYFGLSSNSTGGLDLNNTFTSHTPVEDSPIIIANSYGELVVISPQERILSGNVIRLQYPGYYRLVYSSQQVANLLLQNACVKVDNIQYTPTKVDVSNILDLLANEVGLKRVQGEDNVSLRKRCQNVALSKKPIEQISSALGKGISFFWNSSSSLDIAATGWTNPALTSNTYTKFSETLTKVGTGYFLSFVPIGPVKITYYQEVISGDNYTVSGNLIKPNVDFINSYYDKTLVATYICKNYAISSTPSGLRVTPLNLNPTLFYGVVPTAVKITQETSTLDNWYWGGRSLNTVGETNFD